MNLDFYPTNVFSEKFNMTAQKDTQLNYHAATLVIKGVRNALNEILEDLYMLNKKGRTLSIL